MQFQKNLAEIREANRDEIQETQPTAEFSKGMINNTLFSLLPPTVMLNELDNLAMAILTTIDSAWEDYRSANRK